MTSNSPTFFHLHLISDATGETLHAVAKAVSAQFENIRAIEHSYALVRSPKQLERAFQTIEESPGLIMYTLVNPKLRSQLESRCQALNMPYLSILDPVVAAVASYLGVSAENIRPGRQYALDAEYFQRIEALNYTMGHDDGQATVDLDAADVVLVGVSRTSKTPTCIYLANRGVKAANVPIVPGHALPKELENLVKPLVIGLTASPDRLVQVRKNRLLSPTPDIQDTYVDYDLVQDETVFARKLFSRYGWPVIDVTRRSIEETAAAVLNLFSQHKHD